MKKIFTILIGCLITQLSAQEIFEFDYSIIKKQNEIIEHLSTMEQKNEIQLEYGKLLKSYNSLVNSHSTHNADSAIAPLGIPLLVPAIIIDVAAFFIGEDLPVTSLILEDWWFPIDENRRDIKASKELILDYYLSLENKNSNQNFLNNVNYKSNSKKEKTKKTREPRITQKFKFGVTGGYQITDLLLNNFQTTTSEGYFGGIFLNKKFNKTIGLELQILYSQNGSSLVSLEDDNLGVLVFGNPTNFNLTYLQAPILFDVSLGKYINFKLGPQFGYLIEADINGNDSIENLNTFDYGGSAVLGFNLPALNMNISGRLYYGIANIDKIKIYGLNENDKFTNVSLSLGAAFHF